MSLLSEIAGWAGAVLLLAGYVWMTAGRLDGRGRTFQGLNLLGSVGLIVNALHHGAWPSAALNVIWSAVAALALVRGARLSRGSAG